MEIIATCPDSAFGGQVIYKIDHIEDKVLTAYNVDGKDITKARWSKIRYNREGTPYFMARKQRFYFDDFMRIGRA